MKRSLSIAFAALLVGVLTATVLAVLLAPPNQDPLAGKITVLPSGGIRVGGGMSPSDWRLLQERMNPPRNYTLFGPVVSAYPTMAVRGVVKDLPRGASPPSGNAALADAFGRVLSFYGGAAWSLVADHWLGARDLLSLAFGSLTLNARAAGCTGTGNCFWVGGTGNFSDTAHWATTSGGATTGGLPAATDAVTFDASSGAGTATQNSAPFSSGAVVMTNSSVTVSGSSNTWNVGGNWSDANGHFSIGTSVLDFTASATLITTGSGGQATVYSLTVDATKTLSVGNSIGVGGVLTANGAVQDNAVAITIFIRNDANTTDPLVLGASGSVTATAFNRITMYLFTQAASTIDIPGGTYTNTSWNFSPANTVAGLGVQYKLLGNFSANMWTFVMRASAPFYVNSQTFNVSLTGGGSNTCLQEGGIAVTKTGIQATSGTWSLTGCAPNALAFTTANSASFWIKFGSSNWNMFGSWNVTSTTNSTDWSAGTGTVTFQDTNNRSVFSPNLGTTPQFNNAVFDCNGATAEVYTIATNPLIISGTLTVRNSNAGGTEELTDSTNNKGITAGAVTVGTRGILTMGSATIKVNGNWDDHLGTFNKGTSLALMAGAASTINADFYDLEVSGTYTLAANLVVTHNLTIDGAGGSLDTANGFNYSITQGSGGVGAFAINGTLTANNSTITVQGASWNSGSGTFSFGTSLVVFAATGSVTYAGSAGGATFYSLTINGGVTSTFTTDGVGIGGILTVSGHMRFSGSGIRVFIRNDGNTANPLVVSGDINGFDNNLDIMFFFTQNGALIHIPGSVYANMMFRFFPQVNNTEFRFDGNVTAGLIQFFAQAGDNYFINSQTFDVAIQGDSSTTCINDVQIATATYGIKATSGTWSLTCAGGGINLTAASSSTFYIQFGASNWTLNGPLILGVVNTGVNWQAGTGTFTFNTASGGIGITPPAIFPVAAFHNVVMESTTPSNMSYTLGGNLAMDGLLHILGASNVNTVTFDTTLNNYAVNVGSLQIDAFGHWQPRASAIKVTGSNWTTTNGAGDTTSFGGAAFEFGGLSTVSFESALGTTISISDPNNYSETYWNVQVSGGDAITLSTIFIILRHVQVGSGGVGAAIHFTSNALIMKGSSLSPAGDTLDIVAGSTFDNTAIGGGFAFNSVDGFETVPAYNYGAISLFFFQSSNLFNPAGTSYKILAGDVTTTGQCDVYAFFFAPGTTQFVDLNGHTLSCGTLKIGVDGDAVGTISYVKAGSGTMSVGGDVTVGNAGAYITSTAGGSWTVAGQWRNLSTSASWSFAAPITFTSTANKTMTFGNAANFVNLQEFQGAVTFDPNAVATPTFTIAGNALVVGGLLTVKDTNAGGTTTLTDATNNLGITAGAMTIGAQGVLTMGSSTITVNGNWNSTAGTFNCATSAVVFAGTGSLATNSGVAGFFYNMTINAGVVTTFSTAQSVLEILTVNGALVASGGNAQLPFEVFAQDTVGPGAASPVVLGGSGDLSQSGFFVYIYHGTAPSFNVVGTVYQHLNVEGGYNGVAKTDVANLTANLSTPSCGVNVNCAFLIRQEVGGFGTLTFNTQNHSVSIGGTFWVGDIGSSAGGAVLNAGSSTVICFGFSPNNGGVANLGTSTWTIHPSSGDATLSFYLSSNGVVAKAFLQGSTVTLDSGFKAFNALDVLDMGTASLTVGGSWTNLSASALWNAASGVVNFTGAGTITTALGIAFPEFKTVNFANGSAYTMGANPLTFAAFTVGNAGTFTMNAFPVRGVTMQANTGYIALDKWLAFSSTDVKWHFTPSAAGATVTMSLTNATPGVTYTLFRDAVSLLAAVATGAGLASFLVVGGWSAHTMEIINLSGGGPAPGGGQQVGFDWRVTGDFEVTFTVTVTVDNATYVWLIGGSQVGEGQQMVRTFDHSGKYEVTVQALVGGAVQSQSTKVVTVAALSFLAANMPVLLLLALGAWFIVMVLAVFDKLLGRVLGLFGGLLFIGAGFVLSARDFTQVGLGSASAIMLYAGAATVGGSGVAGTKSRGLALALFVVGIVVLLWGLWPIASA